MVDKKEEAKPEAEAEEKKNEPHLVEDPETKEMVSKSELKRRVKQREKDKKKTAKKEEVFGSQDNCVEEERGKEKRREKRGRT